MLKSKTSAKRLVTVDGVEKSRSHVARTGWFPQLFRGGRYLTELFYAIVTSLKCGEHQRPDIFTASNFNGLIRSHVLEPNISDASFPSFISIPLSFLIFHFYLRVLLFFEANSGPDSRNIFEQRSIEPRNCVLPLFKRNKLPTRRIVGWQSKRVVYRWIVKLRGFHAATRLHLEIRPLIARWRSSCRRGTIIMA